MMDSLSPLRGGEGSGGAVRSDGVSSVGSRWKRSWPSGVPHVAASPLLGTWLSKMARAQKGCGAEKRALSDCSSMSEEVGEDLIESIRSTAAEMAEEPRKTPWRLVWWMTRTAARQNSAMRRRLKSTGWTEDMLLSPVRMRLDNASMMMRPEPREMAR